MINQKTVTAIILIAGSSTRYGTGKNKNFEEIENKTVMEYSLNAFNENKYIDNIILAIRKEEGKQVEKILQTKTNNTTKNKEIKIVYGGNTRQESVYNCLKATNSDIVIIHDGARPCIKQAFIDKCIESMDKYKGVTIGVLSKDTIKITNDEGVVINSTKRSNTWVIQTPQCFDRKILFDLHEKYKDIEVTDDCMILENGGYDIKILQGDYTNIKITTHEDIDIVKAFLLKDKDNV